MDAQRYVKNHDVSTMTYKKFLKIIRKQVYTIKYRRMVSWWYLKQNMISHYTTKFHKQDISLGISINDHVEFIKYFKGLHKRIQKKLKLFKVEITD